jgi:CelD/BcsL family acetyltransferase involved in cellulose biosynthesis
MAGVGIGSTGPTGAGPAGIGLAAARPLHGTHFAVAPADSVPADAWADLADRAEGDNVFFDPAFVLPATGHLQSGVEIATVKDANGRLIGAAPFTATRLGRVAPAVRLFGHDYAPLGAPLIDGRAIRDTVAWLVEGLAAGQSLIVPDLPLDGRLAAAIADFARGRMRPVVVLDEHERAMLVRSGGAPVDPRAALASKRRKEFQRQTKKLGEGGAVSFTVAVEPDDVAAAFDEFLILEEVGWKGRGGSALLSRPETKAFAEEALKGLARRSKVRVDTLRVAGKAIAVLVTFLAGETAYTWKIAYDEAFARYSPGALLMLEAGRGLFDDPGIARVDSCASADHPMIDHLWKDRLRIGTLIVGPPGGGLLFRAGLAAAKAELDARTLARRVRARLH